MRITLVHNPRAGEGRPTKKQLLKSLEDVGYRPVYRTTKEPDWETALDDPGQLVVVAGGDGTVAKVAKHLAGRGVPIALLPLGTANNIACSLGGSTDLSKMPLAERWRSAHATTMDVGAAHGPWGDRAFLESVGCGLFADLLARELANGKKKRKTNNRQKAVQKARRELADALEDARPIRCRVEVNGEDHSGDFILVEAMNIRSIGPALMLAPEANSGDGELDVVFLSEDNRDAFLTFLHSPVSNEVLPPQLVTRRGRDVIIDAGENAVHLDDRVPHEKGSTRPMTGPVRLRLHARNLTFLVS